MENAKLKEEWYQNLEVEQYRNPEKDATEEKNALFRYRNLLTLMQANLLDPHSNDHISKVAAAFPKNMKSDKILTREQEKIMFQPYNDPEIIPFQLQYEHFLRLVNQQQAAVGEPSEPKIQWSKDYSLPNLDQFVELKHEKEPDLPPARESSKKPERQISKPSKPPTPATKPSKPAAIFQTRPRDPPPHPHVKRDLDSPQQENNPPNKRLSAFMTASERLAREERKKGKHPPATKPVGASKPFQSHSKPSGSYHPAKTVVQGTPEEEEDIDPRLKKCPKELIERIELEIMDHNEPIKFDEIAGLGHAKKCVTELIIWPMKRPELFTGLRCLPKGLLLFGPPGTGKTLIGKALATESGATFFSISASSLTSKWIGEGEKLVRTLFAVATVKQPSVIFIDEIDSLLTQRSSDENEASRRMKTEFLVQLDGAGTNKNDLVLIVGATNRPGELDEAVRRRFVKRLYIPLPTQEARYELIKELLRKNKHSLTDCDIEALAASTDQYSGADLKSLCTEAAMGPIRSCEDISTANLDDVRPISKQDFDEAMASVRSSVATQDLHAYLDWNKEFGSFQVS